MDAASFKHALEERLERAVGDVWSTDVEVSGSEGSWSVSVELEAYSPLGEDLVPYLTAEGSDMDEVWDALALDALALYEDFNPEDHAAGWYEARDKVRGVPDSLRGLLEDADDIGRMYEDLYRRIQKG